MGNIATEEHENLIKKSFLENALKQEGKYGSDIASFKVSAGSKPGDNYTSLIYSIDLQLKGEDKTRSLIIKCYPNHPERQHFASKSNFFFKELEVYNKWVPELYRMQREVLKFSEEEVIQLPYPNFVHGESIDFESDEGKTQTSRFMEISENFIIMEDVKKMYGFKTTNRREIFDLDHMQLAIKALAKVHSLSWAYKNHVEPNIPQKFPCLVPTLGKEEVEMWLDMTAGNMSQAAEILDREGEPVLANGTRKFRDTALQSALDFFIGSSAEEVIENVVRKMPNPKDFGRQDDFKEVPWRIICHGDCWSNNMMFKYDSEGKPIEIILFDLQMCNEGCLVKDLEYVFHSSCDSVFRKANLDSLLQLYHDEFNQNCRKLRVESLPGFSIGELKYRFERAKFLGFFMASCGMPLMLQEEDKVLDMEKFDKDADLGEMFKETAQIGDNPVYIRRMMDVTRDMFEHGVI